jgi:hypothetical protein
VSFIVVLVVGRPAVVVVHRDVPEVAEKRQQNRLVPFFHPQVDAQRA